MALPIAGAGLLVWISTALIPRIAPFFSSLAVQVLVTLGFSFTVVEGVSLGFDFFVDYMDSYLSGIPSDIRGVLGLLGVDEAINAILTGILFTIGIRALNGKKYLPSFGKGRE
ncbi:DUF2523 domain-containing protein [Grimontia hollisae]|uniref:DUF2523 domain-containing protein n=1 Tax=Grimontia hollisae TaxID=673 RepID=UPI0023D9B637|nr:DUF2523 domain-containing protein [Grimontia hollisae]MDF2186305.1 DUF2523 domain-containing protein [Grimontia hollisae]